MKKIKFLALISMLLFTIMSFGKGDVDVKSTATKRNVKASKTLIIYYSETGTTEKVAMELKGKLNADIVKIEKATPYSTDTNVMRATAQEEFNTKNWPAIKPVNVKISNYDKIIIGTPVWFSQPATPLIGFLTKQDFKGKEVSVFATYGGNAGEIIKNTEGFVKNAKFIMGKTFKGADVNNGSYVKDLTEWSKMF